MKPFFPLGPPIPCIPPAVPSAFCSGLGERVEDRARRDSLVTSALSVLLEGQTWEVRNPKQWVIQKACIFGFEMHGVIAGSSSSRFTFLIRQIFK